MAFNKAREEYKWKKWKEKEEKQLRELGASETMIEELRKYDWMCFCRERSYRERQTPDTDAIEEREDVYRRWQVSQPLSIMELINAVDDQRLCRELMRTDTVTLRIILLKTLGYSTKEIAIQLGMKPNTIAARMMRLRKRLKNCLF